MFRWLRRRKDRKMSDQSDTPPEAAPGEVNPAEVATTDETQAPPAETAGAITPPAEVAKAQMPRLWNDYLTQYSDDGGQTWIDAGGVLPQVLTHASPIEVSADVEQEQVQEGTTLPEPGQVRD